MKIDKTQFKSLLLEKKVSQKDIAEAIDVSKSVVNSWFSRGVIPDQYIIILNKILNVDIATYFDQEYAKSVSEPRVSYGRSSACAHYIQRISDLEANLRDKQMIIELLQVQAEAVRQHAKKE